MNTLYKQKLENFQKAVNRQEGCYVPTTMLNSGGALAWAGKKVFDICSDPQVYADAMTKVLSEVWIDGNIFCGISTTPRLSDAIPEAENRFSSEGTLTHLQLSPMHEDEYDALIADPAGFIANVLLPRKYASLYNDRDAAKTALKVFAEEMFGNMVRQVGVTTQFLQEKYGVFSFVNLGLVLNTPFDYLFDYFRGFRGTLTDLRRHPDKVRKALDAIWEYRWADRIRTPCDASKGYAFEPCHIPAYLSPKQYAELYWPHEKQLIEWVYNSGGKTFIALEGRWDKIMDCFLDVPKDSCVLLVDDDDFLEAHKRLGHHQILRGGLKVADVRLKSFPQLRDDLARLVDTCAPGGAFLFNTNKVWLAPGDVNQTLIDSYNFVHTYSSK